MKRLEQLVMPLVYKRITLPVTQSTHLYEEIKNMAKKKKLIAKKKSVAVATPAVAEKKKKGSPIVVFLPRKLKGIAKLAATASGSTLSEVVRTWLAEEYVPSQSKALSKMVADQLKGVNVADDEEDEVEKEEEDTDDAEESDDEDEEEDEDDEEEEDDEDEE